MSDVPNEYRKEIVLRRASENGGSLPKIGGWFVAATAASSVLGFCMILLIGPMVVEEVVRTRTIVEITIFLKILGAVFLASGFVAAKIVFDRERDWKILVDDLRRRASSQNHS